MKKSEFISLVGDLARTLDFMLNAAESGDLKECDSKCIPDEQELLKQIRRFQASAVFINKQDEEDINFSEFLSTCIFNQGTPLTLELEDEGFFARMCHIWLEESPHNDATFMLTETSTIPIKNLVYLDGRYEDATEILAFMKSSEQDGKNIYSNPAKIDKTPFSQRAIDILKKHAVTKDYIIEYERTQIRIATLLELPNEFYDALHDYLCRLFEIGNRDTEIWSFPERNIAACLVERVNFLERMRDCCSDEQLDLLPKKKIKAFYERNPVPAEVAFDSVIHGRNEWGCVITQQIFLWFMLREKRPELFPPKGLRNSGQGRLFNFNGGSHATPMATLQSRQPPLPRAPFFGAASASAEPSFGPVPVNIMIDIVYPDTQIFLRRLSEVVDVANIHPDAQIFLRRLLAAVDVARPSLNVNPDTQIILTRLSTAVNAARPSPNPATISGDIITRGFFNSIRNVTVTVRDGNSSDDELLNVFRPG